MKDFTSKVYRILLDTLMLQGYSFYSFIRSASSREKKVVILRNDVDLLPTSSLQFARIQAEKGIKGSYYFRIVPQSFNEKIIKEIYLLGHEIGYHYEEVGSTVLWVSGSIGEKEIVKLSIEEFRKNLDKMRSIASVNSICMHGSPMSRWDNRLLWKYYDYKDFGVIGEPYFDVDFKEMLYLTDTGRRWDGRFVSVRDKAQGSRQEKIRSKREKVTGRLEKPVNGNWYDREINDKYSDWKVKPKTGSLMNMTQKSLDFQEKYKFRSTFDIIMAAEKGELPDKIMMTFHPQRWIDKPLPWLKELAYQNVKNVGKYFLIKLKE